MFKDLKSKAGQAEVNEFLKNRSYLDGYTASKADLEVYEGLGSDFHASHDLPYLTRWHHHIKSYVCQEPKEPFVQQFCDAKVSGASCSAAKKEVKEEDDDDVDLFGDDDEDDEEKERIKQERLQAYAEKKSKKAAVIAKSNIILDVKPWSDETDMAALEKEVRAISSDGLIWGPSKLMPVAYGVKKLQIGCVVEDDKVGTDFLEEAITALEEYVQSVDIAAFNKI